MQINQKFELEGKKMNIVATRTDNSAKIVALNQITDEDDDKQKYEIIVYDWVEKNKKRYGFYETEDAKCLEFILIKGTHPVIFSD